MDMFYLLIIVMPYAMYLFTSQRYVNFNDKTLYFGVRLPFDFELTKELKDFQSKYKKRNVIVLTTILVIASILYFIVPDEFTPSVGIVYIFLATVSVYINYGLINKEVSNIKQRDKFSGYSKNIVIVDLNHRIDIKNNKSIGWRIFLLPLSIIIFTAGMLINSFNNIKDQMIPISFKANGVINEYEKIGNTISLFEYLSPVYIQIFVLAIIIISYIIIIKSKQMINGGEVENLKEFNKKTKQVSVYVLVVAATIVEILLMSIAIHSTIGSGIMMVVTIGFAIISTVLSIIYYEKVIAKYKINYEVENGKMHINRDDDNLFISGMFYNNVNDNAFFVPKRIGAGFDFNYGNLKVRIFVGILSVLIIGVLMFTAFIMPFDLKDKTPIITKNSIKITGMYEVNIKKEEIASITLENLPESMNRTNGVGMDTKLLGNFKVDNKYRAKLYIGNPKEKAIRILLKNGDLIYINHSKVDSTNNLFNTLNSFKSN